MRDGVNGGVAAPNDRHAITHRHLVQRARVNLLDELERLDHSRQILARDVQPRAFAQPQPEEQGVEFLLNLLNRHVPADLDPAAELDAQALESLPLPPGSPRASSCTHRQWFKAWASSSAAASRSVATCRFEEIQKEFDALFLGLGLGKGARLNVPGEDLPGVVEAIEFIEQVHQRPLHQVPVGDRVAVIGGGNTAIDAVTQARRLGARDAVIVYRRRPDGGARV